MLSKEVAWVRSLPDHKLANITNLPEATEEIRPMPNYQLTVAKMEFILAIFKLARYVDLKFSKALPVEQQNNNGFN